MYQGSPFCEGMLQDNTTRWWCSLLYSLFHISYIIYSSHNSLSLLNSSNTKGCWLSALSGSWVTTHQVGELWQRGLVKRWEGVCVYGDGARVYIGFSNLRVAQWPQTWSERSESMGYLAVSTSGKFPTLYSHAQGQEYKAKHCYMKHFTSTGYIMIKTLSLIFDPHNYLIRF